MTQIIKNILCFGDSNTWGLNPKTGKRFDENTRWTSLLNKNLGAGFNVIEAGQPNRTLVHNPPFDGVLSGVSYLKPYLDAYELNFIIIALGTNDLKKRFDLTPSTIANGLNDLINAIKMYYQSNSNPVPQVVVICPAKIRLTGQYARIYNGADAKLKSLFNEFKKVADNHKYECLSLSSIEVSAEDGIHFNAKEHVDISHKMANIIGRLTGGN